MAGAVPEGLVEWLRLQLDADQQKIAAILRRSPNWRVDSEPWDAGVGVRNDQGYTVAVAVGDYAAEHIANWDPSRVLREVEARRNRLDRHRPIEADDTDWVACSHCRVTWPCADLRDDLAVYADRPGYQESWRPT